MQKMHKCTNAQKYKKNILKTQKVQKYKNNGGPAISRKKEKREKNAKEKKRSKEWTYAPAISTLYLL